MESQDTAVHESVFKPHLQLLDAAESAFSFAHLIHRRDCADDRYLFTIDHGIRSESHGAQNIHDISVNMAVDRYPTQNANDIAVHVSIDNTFASDRHHVTCGLPFANREFRSDIRLPAVVNAMDAGLLACTGFTRGRRGLFLFFLFGPTPKNPKLGIPFPRRV